MSDFNSWNEKIIKEYRENEGELSGDFEGKPVLLLHNEGRKTGKAYVNPVMYQEVGEGRFAVFASKGGMPTDPDWYRNVLENPDVQVEFGARKIKARAREATGVERERIWERQKKDFPQFADYEKATEGIREIPVVVLEAA